MTQEQFYKSKKWEAFRKVIIEQRTEPDGHVHCCACGKPIVNKYDLIIHHKQELSDANVGDVMISLNPDNVECICFRCHNKIHDRFGYGSGKHDGDQDPEGRSHYRPVQKRVFIVYGSPCSGKTTFVREQAGPDDLIVDIDSIWESISVNPRYTKHGTLKSVVFEMRDKLYDIIKYRSGHWSTAYVIVGGALKGDRERLKQRISADEFVFIDESYTTCIERLANRNISEEQFTEWKGYIQKWFEQYQPD